MKKNFIKNLIITVTLFLPLFTYAQLVPDDINLSLSPSNPRANQTVLASIKSYDVNLDVADIVWYVNDKIKQREIGQKEFSFQTSSLGKRTKLSVIIITKDNKKIEKNFVIKPSEVDLIWEADSLVPPFYKGKALNTHKAFITVTAIPNFIKNNGSKIDPQTLVYKWEEGVRVQGKKSGYGKQTFTFKGPSIYDEKLISVEVSTTDGTMTAQSHVKIKTYQPKVIFYEDNSLQGIRYEKALTNTFTLKSEESSVIAFPFFFSGKNEKVKELQYLWSMNGRDITSNTDPNRLILRQKNKSDKEETAQIGLEVRNTQKIMQFTESNLNIIFGGFKIKSKDFFGF